MSAVHTAQRTIVAAWLTSAVFAGAPVPPQPAPPVIEPNLPLALAEVGALDGPALTDVQPDPAPPPKRSTTFAINLVNRLVKKGVLDQTEADELIKQADEDTATARQESAAVAVQAAAEVHTVLTPTTPPPGAVRVAYIPETVKAELREQIKADVMAKARDEKWAAPRTLPDWASRLKLAGDVRVRGEAIMYPSGNDNTGAFPNFNAINTGAPFDVSGTQFSPQLNADQDRTRMRLRVRLGAEANLGEGFTAGVRVATGNDNSPVATNQTLGAAGGAQGGNFSKYALWLDRGYLKYELGGQTTRNLAIMAGRFDNPFFKTSEIQFDDDVGFDGVAAHARYEVTKGFVPFITGGAFPIFNTDLNFATNNPAKFKSTDKWLYGAQAGLVVKPAKKIEFRGAVAYYDFKDLEGKLSKPFVPLSASDAGDTDGTRPAFAQKGNTYRPIRDIIPTVDNDFGTSKQFQYFGLATPFRDLSINAQLDFNHFEPVQISLLGEYVRNLAFHQSSIDPIAVNNRGPNNGSGLPGKFDGGDTAWFAGIRVGNAILQKRWDWNAGLSYRHVESDAVVDGFSDNEFGLGGTNMEGYSVNGAVALSPNISLGLRWMSANEIAGPPLKTDIFQIDLNGKF